jgi:hypothetical protein
MTLTVLFQYIEQDTLEDFSAALNLYLESEDHTIDDFDRMGEEDTLLMHASFYCRLDIVKFLVQNKKANINAINCGGMTALTIALQANSPHWSKATAEFLLEQEDINTQIGYYYSTNLVFTDQNETHKKLYQSLIIKGVDITPFLTCALQQSSFSTSSIKRNKKAAAKMICLCLKEEGHFMPLLPDVKYSKAKKNYLKERIEHNRAVMTHAAAQGLEIKKHTNLDRTVSSIVSQYLYEESFLQNRFDKGFLGHPPIIMSASLLPRTKKLNSETIQNHTRSSPHEHAPTNSESECIFDDTMRKPRNRKKKA